ncbi:hypothetical protein ACHAQF_008174 [Verticillium nonalfalfae]
MDPASLVGLIGSIVSIVDATSTATHKLLKSAKLPDAFKQVEKHLPLVKQTLEDARRTIDKSITEKQRIEIQDVLHDCNSKARELDRIFKDLGMKCNQVGGEKSWDTIRGWYRHILQGAKGHRVEALMNDIMGSLIKLGTLSTFRTATHKDMEDIKRALHELSNIEPSLDDADFEATGSNYAHQTVASGAVGQQNNPTGGTNTFESSADQFWPDLHVTDPRDDKARIESTKGGFGVDYDSWILTYNGFKTWRNNPDSRLLWIRGGSRKGKTLLLCSIINELSETSRETEKPAFFFCQNSDKRLNSGTAVLRGLIFFLIDQHPQLMSHVREEYCKKGNNLFINKNAWVALSRILTNMVVDTLLKDKIIIIDALDECATDKYWLLDLILKLCSSSSAKWLFSSRNPRSIECILATATKDTTLCLELKEASVLSTIYMYIKREAENLKSDSERFFGKERCDRVKQDLVNDFNQTLAQVD